MSARRSLYALERSLARLAAHARDINRNNSATPRGKPRRKLKLLPARRKALRLQGRYLGYMRQLKSRAEVRALRAKEGGRGGDQAGTQACCQVERLPAEDAQSPEQEGNR